MRAHLVCPGSCSRWALLPRITKEQWGWLVVRFHHQYNRNSKVKYLVWSPGKGQHMVGYQSTARLPQLSQGMCANWPLEGTSAIHIGRGGGEAKSEAGNCAQWVCRNPAVPWVAGSASVLRCEHLTVASRYRWDSGWRARGWHSLWTGLCITASHSWWWEWPVYRQGRVRYALENFPIPI